MESILNQITYLDKFSSNAKLIQIPSEGQTYDYKPQNVIDAENYTLSRRNSAGLYLLPTEKPKLWLNFVPQKIVVKDSNLGQFTETKFTFFVEDPEIIPDLFTLPDGTIFRCTSDDSLPKQPNEYTYYLMDDGKAKLIPNYKTLEVLLAERQQTLLSVKVLTDNECEDIPKEGNVPDKSGAWNSDMEDITTTQKLKALENNVKSGAAIADAAKASATQQIDAVKAQAAADKAAADAAKAQAEAAKAASDAAIAEAEAKKAELDAKLAGL